jgi:hypothetical protein
MSLHCLNGFDHSRARLTFHHDITRILLKVALNTIKPKTDGNKFVKLDSESLTSIEL